MIVSNAVAASVEAMPQIRWTRRNTTIHGTALVITIRRRSRTMKAASGGMSRAGTAPATKAGTSWNRTAMTPALL